MIKHPVIQLTHRINGAINNADTREVYGLQCGGYKETTLFTGFKILVSTG